MRIGLLCGDGVPVSGLLTVLRNVVELAIEDGLIEPAIPADLGYSWRPDKAMFFPNGSDDVVYPTWLEVTTHDIGTRISPDQLAAELDSIRVGVARDGGTAQQRHSLRGRIEHLVPLYANHFERWWERNDPDWVIAVNMTLSDAVPATRALHEVAARRYHSRGAGGVVFWDHDLFGSCAIRDPRSGARYYPPRPNQFTPVPQRNAWTRWAVVSKDLARETTDYPTELVPVVVDNVLPVVSRGELRAEQHEFARQHRLDPGRPILLNPVRVFRVKGVEIALRLLQAIKRHATAAGDEPPHLLVFGSRDEEPDYAEEIAELVASLDVMSDVRFLDGVPLATHRDASGQVHLDEVDLLGLASAARGGVVFTPAVSDVETVGLGPGLAAVAGLPCLTTHYNAFTRVYGDDLWCVRASISEDGLRAAASGFLDVLRRFRTGDGEVARRLERNRTLVEATFSNGPWRELWRSLARDLTTGTRRRPDPATPAVGPDA